MKREIDWRTRLNAERETSRLLPFVWGQNDCCTFTARCVKAVIGVDLSKGLTGKYKSARGAVAVLKRAGFSDVTELAASHFEEISVSMVRAGDLAAIKTEQTGWALGVIIGERIAVLGPEGMGSIAISEAAKAYRVG